MKTLLCSREEARHVGEHLVCSTPWTKNLPRWPARNSGCSLFSGSALKTAGDAFTSNKVTGHKSVSERTAWWWGSLHSLFDCECVCACFNVCLHLRANIREAWGVVLTLKIDGWSLRKKKRPIFYCNNTGTTPVCACARARVCVYLFLGERIKPIDMLLCWILWCFILSLLHYATVSMQ